MKLIDKNADREMISYLQSKSTGGSGDYSHPQEINMMSGEYNVPDRVRVNDLIDQDGFTLLHMAVFKNK